MNQANIKIIILINLKSNKMIIQEKDLRIILAKVKVGKVAYKTILIILK